MELGCFDVLISVDERLVEWLMVVMPITRMRSVVVLSVNGAGVADEAIGEQYCCVD